MSDTFDEPHSVNQFERYSSNITDEKSRNAFTAALEKTKKYEQSGGYRIEQSFILLSQSSLIVDGNFDRLDELIHDWKEISGEEGSLPYHDTAVEFGNEFLRRLSNYVGSMNNRKEHTLNEVVPVLDDVLDEGHPVSEIYTDKLDEFGVRGKGEFFQGLRNYIVHEGFPRYIIYVDEGPPEFTIDKDEVLTSSKWNSAGKGYADSFQGPIIVSEAVVEYHESVERLYEWLEAHVKACFEEEFQKSRRLRGEARKAQDRFYESADIEMMTIKWEKSDGS